MGVTLPVITWFEGGGGTCSHDNFKVGHVTLVPSLQPMQDALVKMSRNKFQVNYQEKLFILQC